MAQKTGRKKEKSRAIELKNRKTRRSRISRFASCPPETRRSRITTLLRKNVDRQDIRMEESDSGSFRALGERVSASSRGFESHLLRLRFAGAHQSEGELPLSLQ